MIYWKICIHPISQAIHLFSYRSTSPTNIAAAESIMKAYNSRVAKVRVLQDDAIYYDRDLFDMHKFYCGDHWSDSKFIPKVQIHQLANYWTVLSIPFWDREINHRVWACIRSISGPLGLITWDFLPESSSQEQFSTAPYSRLVVCAVPSMFRAIKKQDLLFVCVFDGLGHRATCRTPRCLQIIDGQWNNAKIPNLSNSIAI